MSKPLKLANTCEECMYRNEFFKVRNELKIIERKLVRCKDCRFMRAEDDDMVCGFEYGLGGSVRPNIDYCSYGERIEE